MIIQFNQLKGSVHHNDCANKTNPTMKELRWDGDMTLFECKACGKKGYYPHGEIGCQKVMEII